MVIREMEEKDIKQLIKLQQESFTTKWKEKDFLKALSLSYGLNLVAAYDETVIGFLSSTLLFDTADLNLIVVETEYRSKGIGMQMLKEFEEVVKVRGGNRIMLEVRDSNAPAKRLYEKFDFKEINVRKDYYSNPVEDALVMEKKIYA